MKFACIMKELTSGLAGFLFRRKSADGYPGKGFFGKPEPEQRAKVNREICRGCGDCCSACYYRRIRIDVKGRARVRRGCFGCSACVNVCPSNAITMIDNV